MGYKLAFDLHIRPGMTDLEIARIKAFQLLVTPYDIAVYGGDVMELTWFSKAEVEACRAYNEFKRRSRLQDKLLWGNHDPLLSGAQELFVVDGTIIMHGHQFDKYANGCAQKTYYHWAPWVRGIWLKSPWEQKMAKDTSWTKHNGQIWGAAVNWLEASEYERLIMGHTHDSVEMNRPVSWKQLYSVGSLPEDGVYFDVDDMQVKEVVV